MLLEMEDDDDDDDEEEEEGEDDLGIVHLKGIFLMMVLPNL